MVTRAADRLGAVGGKRNQVYRPLPVVQVLVGGGVRGTKNTIGMLLETHIPDGLGDTANPVGVRVEGLAPWDASGSGVVHDARIFSNHRGVASRLNERTLTKVGQWVHVVVAGYQVLEVGSVSGTWTELVP